MVEDRPFWRQSTTTAVTATVVKPQSSRLMPSQELMMSGNGERMSVAPPTTTTLPPLPPLPPPPMMRSGGSGGHGVDRYLSETEQANLRRTILTRLMKCEKTPFIFNKKLYLEGLHLSDQDVPIHGLLQSALQEQLHTLSLKKNRRIQSIPTPLVCSLPSLVNLDLSSCGLKQLPKQWDLPKLKSLDLSLNAISEFPCLDFFLGLPQLVELNLYGNRICELRLPEQDDCALSQLRTLDVGYNDLAALPSRLPTGCNLRNLSVPNNLLEYIPPGLVLPGGSSKLTYLDVSSNPVREPPFHVSSGGLKCMRRYYQKKQQLQHHRPTSRELHSGRSSSSHLTRRPSISTYNSGVSSIGMLSRDCPHSKPAEIPRQLTASKSKKPSKTLFGKGSGELRKNASASATQSVSKQNLHNSCPDAAVLAVAQKYEKKKRMFGSEQKATREPSTSLFWHGRRRSSTYSVGGGGAADGLASPLAWGGPPPTPPRRNGRPSSLGETEDIWEMFERRGMHGGQIPPTVSLPRSVASRIAEHWRAMEYAYPELVRGDEAEGQERQEAQPSAPVEERKAPQEELNIPLPTFDLPPTNEALDKEGIESSVVEPVAQERAEPAENALAVEQTA